MQVVHVAQLVERARTGDADAFGQLVQRFQNAGFAYALGRVGNPADAEDVLQDAFVTAYLRLGQLREPAAFAGWFRSIVLAQSQQWLRRRSVERRHVDGEIASAEAGPRAGADPAARVAVQRLWSRVRALREPYRSATLLHYLSGFSHAEIAAFLQVPVSTVNGRLQQSRIRLRDALDPEELRQIEMSRIDVAEEVAETLYQVVSEPIHEEIDVEQGRTVVLFCGINADVCLEGAKDSTLRIDGSRTSMGLSEEAARASAGGLELQVDRVDDYRETGPHAGQLFAGSNHVDGTPETATESTASYWHACRDGGGSGVGNLSVPTAFPDLAPRLTGFPDDLDALLRDVVRVSLVQAKAQALVLPPDAYRPALHKVFRPNSTNERWLHGPLGYVAVTVAVPAGVRVVVVRADEVEVRNLQASAWLLDCKAATVEDVEGDVCLLGTPCSSVRRVRGQLTQRWYSFGGMNWSADEALARRSRQFRCRVDEVDGGVDIDAGRADIEVAHCRGTVRVVNRHGSIRLDLGERDGQTRHHLETVSGDVRLHVDEEILPDLRYAVLTLCGRIDYRGLPEGQDRGTANSLQLAVLSPIPGMGGTWADTLEAEVLIKTESGEVLIERAKRL